MNFISTQFAAFLIGTLALFCLVPARARFLVLLVASYLFYATWSWRLIGVILVLTTLVYWMSRLIERQRQAGGTGRAPLWAGIAVSVVILGVFKYAAFAIDSIWSLAALLGWHAIPPAVPIILPLGISFYTFEAIAYLVDVYRGMPAARNVLIYNFYIMYFPHLISGPIIRFNELIGQKPLLLRLPDAARFYRGGKLLVLGVLFKAVFADPAAGLADALFKTPASADAKIAWIGVLAFTVQIYFDFMGYTHIARGTSLLFNLELPLNFNHPYYAASPQDFWRRWHISLSRWIRDYLYIPLSGSRGSMARTCLNLLIVMSIGGLWHGAGWPFVLWGAYHGGLLAANHLWRASWFGPASAWLWQRVPAYRAVCIAMTFLLVMAGWVLFRSPDLGTAQIVFTKLAALDDLARGLSTEIGNQDYSSVATMLWLLGLCFLGPVLEQATRGVGSAMPLWVRTGAVGAAVALAIVMSAGATKTFIYFQF